MIRDNDLHTGLKIGAVLVQKQEEFADCRLVLIRQSIDSSVDVAFRRIMRLRRLVEHQKAGNGPAPPPEELMQAKVSCNMVAHPVLAAAHLRERKRAFVSVRNNREMLEVKP